MPSAALLSLYAALAEIDALQRANPSPLRGGGLARPQIVRAIGRAEIVLLVSHLERYLYAVNEEALQHILACNLQASQVPEEIRLLHTRDPIDELTAMQWKNRGDKLRFYSTNEAGLWIDDRPVTSLVADRLLTWMKTPSCKSILRFFNMWGIGDVFAAVTRKPTTRKRLWLQIAVLVDKRNNIAHGDLTTQATYLDIVQYKTAVSTFCSRADRRMARRLAVITDKAPLW